MNPFDYTLFDVTKEAGSHLCALYSRLSITSSTDAESNWWRMKNWALKSFPDSMKFTTRDDMKRIIALINTEIKFLEKSYTDQLDLIRNKENTTQLNEIREARKLPINYLATKLTPSLLAELDARAHQLRRLYTHLAVSAPTIVEEHWWMLKLSEMAHFPMNIGLHSDENLTTLTNHIHKEIEFLTSNHHETINLLNGSTIKILEERRETSHI